jgi:hypothetical protein
MTIKSPVGAEPLARMKSYLTPMSTSVLVAAAESSTAHVAAISACVTTTVKSSALAAMIAMIAKWMMTITTGETMTMDFERPIMSETRQAVETDFDELRAMTNRLCRLMDWQPSESHKFEGMRRMCGGSATAMSIEKGHQLADRIEACGQEISRLLEERLALAKLAADGPAFYNPLDVIVAVKVRDEILHRHGLNPDGSHQVKQDNSTDAPN